MLSKEKDGVTIRVGDRVKVYTKIKEEDTERTCSFEGIIISIRGAGASCTFTVRRISYGIGIERIFFLNSPAIEKIEVLKGAKIRRAKLYYLRKNFKLKEIIYK